MSNKNIYPVLELGSNAAHEIIRMEARTATPVPATTKTRSPHKEFKRVDQDGDGQVELHELQNRLPHLPKHEVESAFIEHDRNQDGVLDRWEYANLVR